MITEDALKMWCPNIQIVICPTDPTWKGRMTTNRGQFVDGGDVEFCCIADRCPLWCWDKKQERINERYIPGCGSTGDWVDLPKEQWEGHCGLRR